VAKILIADDAAFMRMKSATLLRELGHEVLEAEDGQQAVDMFTEHTPDAVLLDITMPVKDGMDALREIMTVNPEARVAMVTAMGQQQVIMEAIKAGAKDFVVKPFDSDRIQSALWKLVG
jgi:two-component system, chemotaxis family, chemotaxis protein CheY